MLSAMLTKEEVLKIAKLARLSLSDDEVTLYQEKMGAVLKHIEELNALDTAKEGFVKHVPKDAVAFRADKSLPFAGHASLLENAPATEDQSFLLPTIVEHE